MSLKKEMFVAIILGLLLGGVVAIGFAKFPKNLLSQEQTQSPSITPAPSVPTPFVQSSSITLEILLPEQQAYVTDESVTVSGKTQPHVTVVITSSSDELVIQAEDDGTFSGEISLVEGVNELLIAGIANGQTTTKTLIVNYTTEEL